MWSTGMTAEPHMGIPTPRGFLYWFWIREKRDLLMYFGSLLVLLSLCYWIFVLTPLKWTMLSLTRKLVQPQCIACFRLNLWEKEEYFGVGLPCNIQCNIMDHMMFPTSVKLWIILKIPQWWRKFKYDWNWCLAIEKAKFISCLPQLTVPSPNYFVPIK